MPLRHSIVTNKTFGNLLWNESVITGILDVKLVLADTALMPLTESTSSIKNIWVAAGDGDLERVRECVEQEGISPNAQDPNTYTPMHAATSYGHLDVLEYLISKGGDVNVQDEDGDTPLYTAETVEVARYLVEHGARLDITNLEGLTGKPADYLLDDYPHVSNYILSLSTSVGFPQVVTRTEDIQSDDSASGLLESVREIMERARAEGREDVDDELREAIGKGVLAGFSVGQSMEIDEVRNGGQAQSNAGDEMNE